MKTGDRLLLKRGEEEVRAYSVVIYGDSNGDGKLSSADLLITQKHILGLSEIYTARLEAADINNDGTVNSRDLVVCQRKILGLS